jgi:hypothetical protein
MTTVGTLVERHSRYVILLKLPHGHGAQAVREAMTKRILTLPAQLRRSITWELADALRRAFPSVDVASDNGLYRDRLDERLDAIVLRATAN